MKHLLSLFIILCVLSNSAFKAQETNKMNKSDLKEHVLGLSTQIDSLKDVNYMLEESKDSLLLNVSLLESANDRNEIEISRLNNLVVINNQEIERLQSECDIEMATLNETILEYQSSFVNSQDSIVQLQDSLLEYQSFFVNSQDSILNFQNSFVNNQDSIVQLQDAILNCQASFVQLQESVLNYQDLIVQLQDSLYSSQSTTTTSNNFLNNYFFDQIPLPNNSFQLVLSKIVFGDRQINNRDDYYDDDKNKGSVLHLPETLDGNAFSYWSVKPNVMLTDNSKFNDYIILKNKDYFDSNLPQIEILKNKLFTIIYNDDTEESFLFNVKESNPNNQRNTLKIDLANEGVENNTANDIVWRMFAIENECYLALTYIQLNRLKLNLYSYNEGIETSKSDNSYIQFTRDFSSYYSRKTTGNGIYISRNIDSYMNTSEYIKPENLIFLLKLKEL
jgi:hypothetical protein